MPGLSSRQTARLAALVGADGATPRLSLAYIMYRLTLVSALVVFLGWFIPWGVYEDEAVATVVAANVTTSFSSPLRILTLLASGILVVTSGNRRAYFAYRGKLPKFTLSLFGFLAIVATFYLINPDALPQRSVVGSVTTGSALHAGPGLWITVISAVTGVVFTLASYLLDRRRNIGEPPLLP